MESYFYQTAQPGADYAPFQNTLSNMSSHPALAFAPSSAGHPSIPMGWMNMSGSSELENAVRSSFSDLTPHAGWNHANPAIGQQHQYQHIQQSQIQQYPVGYDIQQQQQLPSASSSSSFAQYYSLDPSSAFATQHTQHQQQSQYIFGMMNPESGAMKPQQAHQQTHSHPPQLQPSLVPISMSSSSAFTQISRPSVSAINVTPPAPTPLPAEAAAVAMDEQQVPQQPQHQQELPVKKEVEFIAPQAIIMSPAPSSITGLSSSSSMPFPQKIMESIHNSAAAHFSPPSVSPSASSPSAPSSVIITKVESTTTVLASPATMEGALCLTMLHHSSSSSSSSSLPAAKAVVPTSLLAPPIASGSYLPPASNATASSRVTKRPRRASMSLTIDDHNTGVLHDSDQESSSGSSAEYVQGSLQQGYYESDDAADKQKRGRGRPKRPISSISHQDASSHTPSSSSSSSSSAHSKNEKLTSPNKHSSSSAFKARLPHTPSKSKSVPKKEHHVSMEEDDQGMMDGTPSGSSSAAAAAAAAAHAGMINDTGALAAAALTQADIDRVHDLVDVILDEYHKTFGEHPTKGVRGPESILPVSHRLGRAFSNRKESGRGSGCSRLDDMERMKGALISGQCPTAQSFAKRQSLLVQRVLRCNESLRTELTRYFPGYTVPDLIDTMENASSAPGKHGNTTPRRGAQPIIARPEKRRPVLVQAARNCILRELKAESGFDDSSVASSADGEPKSPSQAAALKKLQATAQTMAEEAADRCAEYAHAICHCSGYMLELVRRKIYATE